MTATIMLAVMVLILPAAIHAADRNSILDPLPCGIYDEAVKPLVQKDLDTQHADKSDYTMTAATKSGKQLMVEVKSVEIIMSGERHQVSAFLDGKPLAKTSHQDVPIYLEIHVDNEKYRIICTRNDEVNSEQTGTGKEMHKRN